MGKRLRKSRSICCCASPRPSYLASHSIFNCYEEDVWTEIAKFLDGKSLVMLAGTCKWFNHIMMEDSVWKFACLRDLQVSDPGDVAVKWIKLYGAAFDGSHTYMFRQQEKHIGNALTWTDVFFPSKSLYIDWMRIGAFLFDSHSAILTENLIKPLRIPQTATPEKTLSREGYCLLNNIKTGIWISDLQLVRCPVCDLDTCDGTMQTLDIRHIELFLDEGYLNGSWTYELLGSHDIRKKSDGASGGIFDFKHINDQSTSEIFDLKTWSGKKNDWQPKAVITLHAVAVNTNLQDNEGLQIKYHAMTAGKDGEVVSLRISQQLL